MSDADHVEASASDGERLEETIEDSEAHGDRVGDRVAHVQDIKSHPINAIKYHEGSDEPPADSQ